VLEIVVVDQCYFLKYFLFDNISTFLYILKFICDTNILKRSKNNKKNQIS